MPLGIMSELLTALTISAVMPFTFNLGVTDGLPKVDKTAVVERKKDKEKPKVEKDVPKKEEPKEAPDDKPVEIVHTIEQGDNLSVIAEKHQTSWVRIWQKNKNIEHQDQLKVGDTLIIPHEDEKLEDRDTVEPPTVVQATEPVQVTSSEPKVQQRASQTVSRPHVGGANTYDWGWCTWWVKEKRPDIGGYWGNAVSWLSSASSSGYQSGSQPVAGAIAYTPAGPYGHVAYVESVQSNTVTISEMGYDWTPGNVNYRTVPASSFTYIY